MPLSNIISFACALVLCLLSQSLQIFDTDLLDFRDAFPENVMGGSSKN